MGNFPGGFLQQKALFGSGEKNPPAARIRHNFIKIKLWIVAENREFEVVLALRLRVAGAGVAPCLGKPGHDLVQKTHRRPSLNSRAASVQTQQAECKKQRYSEKTDYFDAQTVPHRGWQRHNKRDDSKCEKTFGLNLKETFSPAVSFNPENKPPSILLSR
jgi:hypothetical protein